MGESLDSQQEPYRPPPEKIIATLARELAQCNDNRYYLIALVDELQEKIAKLEGELAEGGPEVEQPKGPVVSRRTSAAR